MCLEGRRQGRAAGTGKKRPCRRRPTRSSRGRGRRGKLATGVGVGQRPPDARGTGGTSPPYLPAAARSRRSGRRGVPGCVRPPPIQIPTVGARGQSARGRGRNARGASGQWEAAPAVALPGLGARWARRESESLPDLGSPNGRTGDGCRPRRRPELSGSAADVTGLSGKGGPEPLARVSVYPAVKWDQVQLRPQGGA